MSSIKISMRRNLLLLGKKINAMTSSSLIDNPRNFKNILDLSYISSAGKILSLVPGSFNSALNCRLPRMQLTKQLDQHSVLVGFNAMLISMQC